MVHQSNVVSMQCDSTQYTPHILMEQSISFKFPVKFYQTLAYGPLRSTNFEMLCATNFVYDRQGWHRRGHHPLFWLAWQKLTLFNENQQDTISTCNPPNCRTTDSCCVKENIGRQQKPHSIVVLSVTQCQEDGKQHPTQSNESRKGETIVVP